ncbi:hypothetical protein GJW-30_1_00568 [Variibacter gotjawalensis]|uniref:Uncharacterized protein n=1 Tax=Variibacter gotjawalensis TaxID=1333996 RepID=A0A0S3PQ23_9BRAD|nr:hypothetical protein [Variibacter gotjawalensis]NIK48353.1 regulation of enolase protein 1 (concanavalin A-like superfamily) [Variibacter gotjawalensis]RZS50223.1 hypothetical protein EV661_2678 [Variibacter gotjawalensis]BAT58054.1 hypothetical protein GJW-30_1_00568 [Variibacter gotjawalensis]
MSRDAEIGEETQATLKGCVRTSVMFTESDWTVTRAENNPDVILIAVKTEDGSVHLAVRLNEASRITEQIRSLQG